MDSYAPCPCGSGKKIKFCCQAILNEMAKIERLQENNQPHMALQLIDKLLKEHPDNGWLVTQRAMALFNDENYVEARDSLLPFLRNNPDHPLANALLAIAVSQSEPIEKSKKVIHRAFLKSLSAEPQIVAILAGKLVAHYLDVGQDMAARQHMALVLRLGNEEERQRTLMAMLDLDSDSNIPYPLRGGHPLPAFDPPADIQSQFKKAQRLYVHGCFAEAAELLTTLTEKVPDAPELWHTIGLMSAWDGNESQAAHALHQAARLYQDLDQSVDLEAMAQLLDRRHKDNAVVARIRSYETESLSKLLTRLDNEDRLSRLPLDEQGIAAHYEILDRVLPTEQELDQMTMETVPRSIGRLTLIDQSEPGKPALAHIVAIEGERLDQAVEIFENCSGELVSAVKDEANDDQSDIVALYSKDELALTESAFFPPKTPSHVRKELRKEMVEDSVRQKWMNSPQRALDGKSPAEAAGNDELKVALAAAVRVYDAFLDRKDLILDQAALYSELQLPAAREIPASDDLDLNTLTVAQLQRVSTTGMSDKLFDLVMQRALVVKHSGFAYRILREFVENRPELVSEKSAEADNAYRTLAEICSRALRNGEALEWLSQGFEHSKSKNAPFQTLLMWKMLELQFRVQDLNDPQLKPLLLDLWNHYGAKMPVVRERLQEFVQALEIDAPWEHAILTPDSAGGSGWSSQTEETVGQEKKLWLPD